MTDRSVILKALSYAMGATLFSIVIFIATNRNQFQLATPISMFIRPLSLNRTIELMHLDLRALLTPEITSTWCQKKMPLKVHAIFDAKTQREISTEFKAFNQSLFLATNSTSKISFSVLNGDIFLVKESTILGDRSSKLWNETHVMYGKHFWKSPSTIELKDGCSAVIPSGTYLYFSNFFYNNFPHFLIDHIPTIMILIKISKEGLLGPEYKDAKILIPYSEFTKKTMNFITNGQYKELSGKVSSGLPWSSQTITQLFQYYEVDKVNCFSDSTVVALHYDYIGDDVANHRNHNPIGISIARAVIDKYINVKSPCKKRLIVYYSRNNLKSRQVKNEKEVIATIRSAMNESKVKAGFQLFKGEGSFEKQFDVFRCADVIIGPHGAGMANALWANLSPLCADPVHVIEAVCSSRSAALQSTCPYQESFFLLLSGIPWLKYHKIFFEANATAKSAAMPTHALSALLKGIFDEKYGTKKASGLLLPNTDVMNSAKSIVLGSRYAEAFPYA